MHKPIGEFMLKKTVFILTLVLFFSSDSFALDLSRVKTWSAQEVLTAADLNGDFNNILNHSLTNNDIDAAAAIAGSKLNLLITGGAIGTTTASAGAFTTLTASSTFEATGAATFTSTGIFKDKLSFTQTDNLEYIDSLADGFLDFEATTGLRFRINATEQINLIDGILAGTTDNDIDLGSTTKEFKDLWIDGTANIDSLVADTADINDGTMDGVQVGGTTATGELIVNNSSDDADGLGSQGNIGESLISQGTGVNPIFSPIGQWIFVETLDLDTTATSAVLSTSSDIFMIVLEEAKSSIGNLVLEFNADATAANYDNLTRASATYTYDDNALLILRGVAETVSGTVIFSRLTGTGSNHHTVTMNLNGPDMTVASGQGGVWKSADAITTFTIVSVSGALTR